MEDRNKYIYFYTLNSTGVYTTSGYSLPITPFTFIPIFDDGTTQYYSKQNILWDFGDGTTSEELTATHYYKTAGWYNVKCFVLGKDGVGYEDKFSQSILVRDYITDTIVLSGRSSSINESGKLQNPFTLIRFNTWQAYPELSSVGYTINLHVTGANAPLLDSDVYNLDKFGHLKPSSRFLTRKYNSLTENYELLPVNNLQTTNDEIYVRIRNGAIETCSSTASGATFAGTSGSADFYYVDDMPRQSDDVAVLAATIFATFDTKYFKDSDNFGKTIPEQTYNILNSVFDSNTFSKTIEQLYSDHLTITSNGIDDDNEGNLIDTFYIADTKYTGQKIPFIVRVKDKDEYASKYNPVLHYNGNSVPLTGTNIRLYLRNSINENISDVSFYEELGTLSAETFGGYFRGYMISPNQYNNVKIYTEALPTIKERFLAETNFAVIGEPQSKKIHNIKLQTDVDNVSSKELVDYVFDTTDLSGVFTTCITTNRDLDGVVTSFAWLVDSDREIINKYDTETMNLVYSFSLSSDFGITNGSPSNIAGDKNGNVWVTLYDSISTIKINNLSNLVDATIVPNRVNVVTAYENSITPASVDVDMDNNVWVSYSNGLSSFVEKYNSNGAYLNSVTLISGYQPTEIVCDPIGNVWGILKDNVSNTEFLSSKRDTIFQVTSSGSVVYHTISGSLWNITTDVKKNVWVTRNRNQVARINYTTDDITVFSLSSNSSNSIYNYISDLEGIACTTDNTILVVDNYNRCLHYFNAVQIGNITETILPLTVLGESNTKITAYGDWNGFRHINKFQHTLGVATALKGYSNSFSILSTAKYDIRKINENFNPIEQMKSYRFQEYLQGADKLFDDVIGTSIGDASSSPNVLGKKTYEKISNFTDNIVNVDTCNIDALKSMHHMMDEEFLSFHGDNLNIPSDLYRLIDLFSVGYSKLRASSNKFSENYDDRGYDNDSIRLNGGTVLYGTNKGQQIDFLTATLTASHHIISYEKFSGEYKLLNTDLLSTNYISYIDPTLRTFTLSSYHPNWGWDLILPNDYVLSSFDIHKYYTFYKYISGYNDRQTEGLVNWQDTYTLKEPITSTSQWDSIKESMITYSLAKSLSVI